MTQPTPVRDLGPMAPPVTVVGDVHLAPQAPEVWERFEAFLAALPARGGTLVILGDLFDWWVGPGQARDPFAAGVLEALRQVRQRGVRLAFLAGNRDFHFRGADGLELELWPDVVRTMWGARRVVLSHGDLLCTADRDYLRLRRILRGRFGRAVARTLPYGLSAAIARGLRGLSERTKPRNLGARLGIDYGAARAWLEAYDADALVLGHVHTGVHHRLAGARPREVFVLKDWDGGANAVVWDGGAPRLVGGEAEVSRPAS